MSLFLRNMASGAKMIEDYLIRSETQLEVMLDWALENETASKQSMIADNSGENGNPIEQVDGNAEVVLQLKTVLAQLTEGESLVDRAEFWTKRS